MMKNIKIPKSETLWVQYMNKGNVTHFITSNTYRDKYFLYEVNDGQIIKTKHKADNPLDLEKYLTGGAKS